MRKLIYILITAMMCSCGTYRKYERPDNIHFDLAYRDLDRSNTATIATLSWREFFSDTCLQALIEQGLQNNTDLQIARLKVKEAQAQLQASRLAFLPSVSLGGDGTLSSFDGAKASKSYNAGVNADWEIDISGKKANQLRSDRVEKLRTEAYQHTVQNQLISTIADSYYTLLMLDRQLEISRRTLDSWEGTLKTLKALKRTGDSDESAVNQAEANLLAAKGSILTLEKEVKNEENSMSSLLGITPQVITRGKLEQQQFVSELSVGVPLQLLSNRPDVWQYELELEQAFYATNIARAAFYPNITLAGSAGWTNNGGAAITNPGGILFNAVASLVQPLFNRGTNIANLKISEARQEEALLSFQQKLLDAGIEVNDALSQWQTAKSRCEIDRLQILALQNAVKNTRLTMRYGSTTYLEVLTAEQSLLQAELNEISDKFDEVQGMINLYYSLGGGIY